MLHRITLGLLSFYSSVLMILYLTIAFVNKRPLLHSFESSGNYYVMVLV
jgi:hypothetical protein